MEGALLGWPVRGDSGRRFLQLGTARRSRTPRFGHSGVRRQRAVEHTGFLCNGLNVVGFCHRRWRAPVPCFKERGPSSSRHAGQSASGDCRTRRSCPVPSSVSLHRFEQKYGTQLVTCSKTPEIRSCILAEHRDVRLPFLVDGPSDGKKNTLAKFSFAFGLRRVARQPMS